MKQFSVALPYYEKALEIRQKTVSLNHPSLVALYVNIGSLYGLTGKYSIALSYLKNGFKIAQKSLLSYHANL
jgi:tetratricopeptide (TPR) repeat protein